MTESAAKKITLDLGQQGELGFNVEREHYVAFVNGSIKNPFNAMQNLLASSVDEESRSNLSELIENPANVQELCSAVLEDYTPDVNAVVKKHKS